MFDETDEVEDVTNETDEIEDVTDESLPNGSVVSSASSSISHQFHLYHHHCEEENATEMRRRIYPGTGGECA